MFLQHTYGPALSLTCVEPSIAAITLGRKHFGLVCGPQHLMECSSESFLQTVPETDAFDAILVDTTEPSTEPSTVPRRKRRRGVLAAPHRAVCSGSAIRRLIDRLSPGGVLVFNVLGDEASVRRLQHTVSACFRGASYRLTMEEGNVVLASYTSVDGDGTQSDGATEVSPPDGWMGLCESIGLEVQRLRVGRGPRLEGAGCSGRPEAARGSRLRHSRAVTLTAERESKDSS